MEELEKASGRRLCATGTSRGSRSSSQALLGYLRQRLVRLTLSCRKQAPLLFCQEQ